MVKTLNRNLDFKNYFLNTSQLPLVMEPQEKKQANFLSLEQYLIEKNAHFKAQLLQYGAVLFRGFQIDGVEKFSKLISASSLGAYYNYDFCPIPRTKVEEGITSTANLHPTFNLPLHNERSYERDFPTHVFFNCLQAASSGGYTPLADGHQVWLSLPESLQSKLQHKGILYCRHYYGVGSWYRILEWMTHSLAPLTWRERFSVTDKGQIEAMLEEKGETIQWLLGGGILSKQVLPAYRRHPIKKHLVWFNQSNYFNPYYNTYSDSVVAATSNPLSRFMLLNKYTHPNLAFFGDGEPISKHEADIIHQAIERNTLLFSWQPGDFLILDNYSCLHGKKPHQGDRLLLVGLTRVQEELENA